MKHSVTSLLLLTSVCVHAQDVSQLQHDCKLIPIVEYTPIDFTRTVDNAFSFDPSKECLFIESNTNPAEFYWYNDFQTKRKFTVSKLENRPALSDIQIDILCTYDSAFIFNPLPLYPYELIPQNYRYVGYLDNGKTCYATGSLKFNNLEALITHEFGNTRNFMQLFTDKITDAFYSHASGLYGAESDRAATDILSKSHKFQAISSTDIGKATRQYLDLIKANVELSPRQEEILMNNLSRATIDRESLSSAFLSGKNFDIFDPTLLRTALSTEEYAIAMDAIAEEDARVANAYRHLRYQYPNTAPDGHYYTDRDYLILISDRVLSNKD